MQTIKRVTDVDYSDDGQALRFVIHDAEGNRFPFQIATEMAENLLAPLTECNLEALRVRLSTKGVDVDQRVALQQHETADVMGFNVFAGPDGLLRVLARFVHRAPVAIRLTIPDADGLARLLLKWTGKAQPDPSQMN